MKLGILYGLLAIFFTSCGVSKHIPSGSYLLKKNKIEIIDTTQDIKHNVTASELNKIIIQDPNAKVLGTVKLGMRVYCLSGPNSKNWINNLLRKIGEAPVIYDPSLSNQTSEKIRLYLANKGSFSSSVEVKTTYKKKKATVLYKVYPSRPYNVKEVSYTAEDDTIQKFLTRWKINSTIKSGKYYDLSNLSDDRDKITTMLQNNGYYAFSKDNIIFEVDTNLGNYELNIALKILNPHIYVPERDTIIHEIHKRYKIDNVYIIPQSIAERDSIKYDTTVISLYRRGDYSLQNYTFLHNGKMPVNPKTIAQNLFIDPNSLYSINAGNRTYSSLSSLNNFRYLNINYTIEHQQSDSIPKLNAWIRLAPSKRNSFSTSLDLTNTASGNSDNNNVGNFGLEWSFTYQNKNLFGNAEILNVKYRLFGQLPKSITSTETGNFLSYFSTFETGVNLSLDIPKFLFPLKRGFLLRYFRPRTSFNAGFGYQYRPYYERYIPSIGFGYKWRGSSRVEHSFFPIELNAIKIFIKDSIFQDSVNHLTDQGVKYQYTDHLIMDARYNVLITNQRPGSATNFTTLLAGLESGGNLLYAISKLSNQQKDDNGLYEVTGIPYAQYIRTDFDLKHYFYFSRKYVFVLRGYVGVGFPYGNSYSMPYEKSFYGGGPNGIRAWQMKTLGPGSFQNKTNTLFDRIGDMSLCLNAEQRFPLGSVFEGALFVDVGNIWLQRESEEFPGGEFAFDKFYKELGIGSGFGVRINLTVAIIRFDFAVPLRDPSKDYGERWRLKYLKLNDLVVNFGIGYPF